MSEPKRLLHGAGGPLAAELIAAGRDEMPSEAALSRAIERAALAAGAAATLSLPTLKAAQAASHVGHGVIQSAGAVHATASGSASTGAAALSGGAHGVGVAAGAAKGVSVAVLSKWVGIAAVGIGVSSAVPSALRWFEPAPVSPTATSAAQPHAPAELTSPAAPETPEPPADTVTAGSSAPRPLETARRSGALPARTSVRAPRVSGHTTLEELRMVDGARDALQSGDAARALELLEHYEAEIAERQFELEVGVLRMEAFARLGHSEAAQKQARHLLTRDLSERQAARARTIVAPQAPFE